MSNTLQKDSRLARFRSQQGWSAIEIMIIVVILGIVAAYVVPMLTGVKDKNVTVQQEYNAMQRTVTQIYDRYFTDTIDETTVTNETIMQGRLQSEAYRTAGTSTIYNIFGGLVTIDGVGDNGLTYTSEKIPKTVCASLVSMTRGKLAFETVTVDGNDITFSDATSINDIASACDGVAADSLTITWTKDSN